jgi:hypothetical protein
MQTSSLFDLFVEVGAWAQAHGELVAFALLLPPGYLGFLFLAWCCRNRSRR